MCFGCVVVVGGGSHVLGRGEISVWDGVETTKRGPVRTPISVMASLMVVAGSEATVLLSSIVEKRSDLNSPHSNMATFLGEIQALVTSKPTIGYAHSVNTKKGGSWKWVKNK